MPPIREMDHVIDLHPNAKLVAFPPYQFATPKLTELRTQLDELLENRFIHLSKSP